MALNINGTTGISGVDGSVSAPALTGTDSNTGITFPSADTIKFSTGGIERMSITNSGVSGITAGKVLQVVSSVLDPGSNNYASTSNTPANSGLITTITPLAANSKFIIYQGGNALHLNESVSNRGIRLYIYASVAGGSYANVASDHIMSAHAFLSGLSIDFPYSHTFHATVSYSLGQTVAYQTYYLRGTNSGNGSQQSYYWHHNGGSGADTRIQQIVMEVGA